MNYTFAMIRHAVYNHPNDVIHLLQTNGVNVPPNVDKQTLHVMALTTMKNSDAFKPQLVELLHNIAMEGQYKKYNGISGNNFLNDTGTTPAACQCCCSWFAQTFNPKMVDTLLTAGVGLASKNLLNTCASGVKAATQPTVTPTPKKSNTGLVAVSYTHLTLPTNREV